MEGIECEALDQGDLLASDRARVETVELFARRGLFQGHVLTKHYMRKGSCKHAAFVQIERGDGRDYRSKSSV